MYIGQPWTYPEKLNLKMTSNLKSILKILNPENFPEKFPWETD